MPALLVVARVVVTVLMALVPWALARVPLPSVDLTRAGMPELARFGIMSLAVVILPMCAVELGVAAIPRWRPLRHAGPSGRARLVIATAALALPLVAWNLWVYGEWFASIGAIEPGIGPRLVLALELAAGLVAQLVAARVISRWGIGSGLAVLLISTEVAAWVALNVGPAELPSSGGGGGEFSAPHGALMDFMLYPAASQVPLIAALAAGATLLVLHVKVGGIRHPVAGLAPVVGLTWLGGAVAVALAFILTDYDPNAPLPGALVLTVAALVTALATWRLCPPTSRAVRLRAVVIGSTFAVGLLFLDGRLVGPPTWTNLSMGAPSVLSAVLATALAVDLLAEMRARVVLGSPVAVWSFHDVDRADRAALRLAAARIPHALGGWRVARIRRITAPWAPVRLLVPRAHAADATLIARSEESRPLVERALTALE